LWAINDLGLLFELAGEEDRALDMHERAMKGQEMTLGMDHKTTCWSRAAVEKLKGIKEVDGAV
jgi:lipopolysaccharide biosynthesis regulator YciM